MISKCLILHDVTLMSENKIHSWLPWLHQKTICSIMLFNYVDYSCTIVVGNMARLELHKQRQNTYWYKYVKPASEL